MGELSLSRALRTVDAAISRTVDEHEPTVHVREEGRITSVTDGVLRIEGLASAAYEELLELDRSGEALVLSLEKDALFAVALGSVDRLRHGVGARSTGRSATVAAGDVLLGRVVDPLGRPLDGHRLDGPFRRAPLEARAPQIHERTVVHQPLYTGALAIDAMFPIGRGQRELILGDEGTGKTSLALDVMLRQKETGVICVYVAVGRQRSEVGRILEVLRHGGGRWVVVAAFEDLSPGLRYLAPYSGTAIAESFTKRGEHTLVVYDDLTAHAVAWRELSLLLRRPPGREAYPGDIFYLHSRLLERAAQLSVDAGGGSLTALPLATLQNGRLTAYIPTNLISITDGQIVLSHELFVSGQRPAIDASLSVSRVGAHAQAQAFRELAGKLRLEYASFLELEAFSRLGTRLEASTRRRIEVGRRIRRILRAPRMEPLGIADEVLRLVLASEPDLLRRIPEADVERTLADVSRLFEERHLGVKIAIDRDAVFKEGERRVLSELVRDFVQTRFPELDDG